MNRNLCDTGCRLIPGHPGGCVTTPEALRSHPLSSITTDAVASASGTPGLMLGEAVALGHRLDAIICTARDASLLVDVASDVTAARAHLLEALAALHRAQCAVEVCEASARSHPAPKQEGHAATAPPCPTPAAMLGDAVALSRRASELLDTALKGMPAKDTTGARILVEMAAGESSNAASFAWQAREEIERESEAQRVNCPRGVHGGPGSDACDCAAIAKVQAEAQGWRTCPTHGRRMAPGEQCAACAEVPR